MIPGIRLRAWRALWTACVEHGAPRPILLWVEGHFLDAALRQTLRTVTAETREMVDAVADTIPAPGDGDATSELFGLLRDVGATPTLDGVPVTERELRVEALRRAVSRLNRGDEWSCLAGDVEGHDAGDIDERDLFDTCEQWPSSKTAKGWEA